MAAPQATHHKFSAPWGRQLLLITALCGAILFGISGVLLVRAPENPPLTYQVGIWLPPSLFLLCALFSVRGYELRGNSLVVFRPGWRTRLPLTEVQSVVHQPDATQGSIRIFGNGGLFGFIGLFQNQQLGRYRAFATDFSNSVVIRMPARTLVVTPGDPGAFTELATRIFHPADAD